MFGGFSYSQRKKQKMKIDTKTKYRISICLIFLIGILLMAYVYTHSSKEDMSKRFCDSKGYEQIDHNGAFAPNFGKVKCLSCYLGRCIDKEYNVKEGLFGLEEIKNEE